MINRLILEGRLTADPEKISKGDVTTCTFTIAQNGAKKDDTPLFLSCVAFSYNAKYAAQYLSKGSRVIVEGRLTAFTWKEKKYYKVVVDNLEGILEDKKEHTVDDEIVDCAEAVNESSK